MHGVGGVPQRPTNGRRARTRLGRRVYSSAGRTAAADQSPRVQAAWERPANRSGRPIASGLAGRGSTGRAATHRAGRHVLQGDGRGGRMHAGRALDRSGQPMARPLPFRSQVMRTEDQPQRMHRSRTWCCAEHRPQRSAHAHACMGTQAPFVSNTDGGSDLCGYVTHTIHAHDSALSSFGRSS